MWKATGSCAGPGGGSWSPSFGAQRWWVAAGVVRRASCWTIAKIVIPLLAAAAIDQGIIPGDTQRDRQVLGADRRGRRAPGASAPACAATPRSGSRTASRPTCATGCSRTSSACTSRSTTRRRPASSWRARTPTSSRSTRCSSMLPAHRREPLHPRSASSWSWCSQSVLARAAGARRAAVPQHRGDRASRTGSAPSRFDLQREARRSLRRRRGERRRHPRGQGLRRRAAPGRAPRGRGRRRARSGARGRASCAPGFLPLVDFLPALALVAILWYGGHLVLDGQLQIGDLVAFNSYILMLILPLRMAGMLVAQASRASAVGGPHPRGPRDRLRRSSTRRRGVALPGRRRWRAAVRGRRASRTATGRRCSTGSTSSLRPGEAVAVVGPTASGKTTDRAAHPALLRRRRRPRALDGVDVREPVVARAPARGRHRVRGHVPVLRHASRENIAFADPEATMDAGPPRRAARRRGRLRRGAARRLRDRDRRARLLAVGRAAPAHRHRPRRARRSARAHPRRRDVVGRPDQGARDPGRARAR